LMEEGNLANEFENENGEMEEEEEEFKKKD
jgi:hypothetical protein